MNVNVEFLDREPIENIITSLHFKFDKILFFGYSEVIAQQKKQTEWFLKTACGVGKVNFYPLSHTDLEAVRRVMEHEIKKEYEQGNAVYFDLTGGENLHLVACGMLADLFQAPMHQYIVEKDGLLELTPDNPRQISKDVPEQKVTIDLEQFIALQGGVINDRLHKSSKDLSDLEFTEDIRKLWDIAKKHEGVWNAFSEFLPKLSRSVNAESLEVKMRAASVVTLLNTHTGLRAQQKFNAILDDCERAGILQNLVHENGIYSFAYKNRSLREVLWEAGSILELHTYLVEKERCDDCRVGVHLDWDGILHEKTSEDVYNEIDVLTLNGFIPTFISCKNGSVSQMALYELETVASRFGGKYAKKVLIAPQGVSYGHRMRAEEMGIIVRK